jgi:hypothetical protein
MRRTRRFSSFQPLVRAITVISSVAVLATGVTFAALQSQQAVLTGNSIKTATADLRIGTSATAFSSSRTGFVFGEVVPGASPSPADGNSFYLKNYGGPALALKVGISTTPTNTGNVDLTKTYLVLTRVDTNTTQKFAVSSLVAGGTAAPLAITDSLSGSAVAQYKAQIAMDADAFTGQSADITGIDLVFTGTVVTQ